MSPYNKRITYFGIVKSISSWSKVAREMLSALSSLGAEINIYGRKGFLYDENFDLGSLASKVDNKFSGEAVFTFEHPANYIYLPEKGLKAGFLLYEFTSLPPLWVENINRYLDLVFVPSVFTAEVFLRSGVKKEKLRILRYGVNPAFYYPGPGEKERLTFLCVASPQKREGAGDVLEAFRLAFPGKEDVKLALKLSYNTCRPKSFEVQGFKDMLGKYSSVLGPKLEIIERKLSEAEMGELYRKSSAYFSLSRAESFGLPFLEALACGKPPVAMNYGGQTDFLTEKNSWFVPHGLVPVSGEEYEKTAEKQFAAEPDMAKTVEILRRVHESGGKLKKPCLEKGMEHYRWNKIAAEFLEILGSFSK